MLNYFRGHGPSYESIISDVCMRMHVNGVTKYDTAEEMEQKLLISISKKTIGELDENQVRTIMDECGLQHYKRNKAGLLAALIALQIVNQKFSLLLLRR